MEPIKSTRFQALTNGALLNIAHRGARAYAPENTLPAFAKANLFACQMFEIDVRLSKDGVVVVHHDESLERCTDAQLKFPARPSYQLSEFTVAQLTQLDAGYGYCKQLALPKTEREGYLQALTEEEQMLYISPDELINYQSGQVTIPTLEQTLELAQQLHLLVNIELKAETTNGHRLADKVVAIVQSFNMEQQVLISSFNFDLLHRVRQINTSIALGILTGEPLEHPGDILHSMDADAYHPSCYIDHADTKMRMLNFSDFREVRRNRQGVNVWTCNRKVDMCRLIKAGATGIISDFPNRMQDLMLGLRGYACKA